MLKIRSSSKDVLDYLTHLNKLKKEFKPPFKINKSGDLYNIYDCCGVLFLTCTEKIYKIFDEL